MKQEGQEGVGGRAPTGLGSQPPRRAGTAVPTGPSAGPCSGAGRAPRHGAEVSPRPGGWALAPQTEATGTTPSILETSLEQLPSGTLWAGRLPSRLCFHTGSGLGPSAGARLGQLERGWPRPGRDPASQARSQATCASAPALPLGNQG